MVLSPLPTAVGPDVEVRIPSLTSFLRPQTKREVPLRRWTTVECHSQDLRALDATRLDTLIGGTRETALVPPGLGYPSRFCSRDPDPTQWTPLAVPEPSFDRTEYLSPHPS